MNCARSCITCILCVGFLFQSAKADIIYEFVTIGGFEPGWSLDGGTVTTNGQIGTLAESDILSWSINYTSPNGARSLTSSNSSVAFNPLINGEVVASATELILQPSSFLPSQVSISFSDGATGTLQITANNIIAEPTYFLFDSLNMPDTSSSTLHSPGPRVFATAVPEPSSVALLGFAAACFLARRQKRNFTQLG